jgi:hypothetical protein
MNQDGDHPTVLPQEIYQAPKILWEQEFVALAITSPHCNPDSDPNCTP